MALAWISAISIFQNADSTHDLGLRNELAIDRSPGGVLANGTADLVRHAFQAQLIARHAGATEASVVHTDHVVSPLGVRRIRATVALGGEYRRSLRTRLDDHHAR